MQELSLLLRCKFLWLFRFHVDLYPAPANVIGIYLRKMKRSLARLLAVFHLLFFYCKMHCAFKSAFTCRINYMFKLSFTALNSVLQ